jgi:hypothetical protein
MGRTLIVIGGVHLMLFDAFSSQIPIKSTASEGQEPSDLLPRIHNSEPNCTVFALLTWESGRSPLTSFWIGSCTMYGCYL